jgi:hypothetical protein
MLLCAAVLTAAALGWSPPERVDRKPEGYRTYLPSLTVGPDGRLHVVWSESPVSRFLDKVMYASRQGDTWTIPVNISRDSGDIRMPAIALDSGGQAMVVWSEESYALMRYVRQLGDSWSVPRFCFPNRGITPRLATDSRGRIHLLFEELGGRDAIWYSQFVTDGDSWASPSLVADDSGSLGWSDLAVDRQDHLHAVWMNYRTDGVDYSHNDGSGWSAPVALPDPAPGRQSVLPRIAVDTCDCPHVVWEERSGGYWLYHSTREADSWTTPVRFYASEGASPVIAGGPDERVDVIWSWDNGVFGRSRSDTSWSTPETLDRQMSFETGLCRAGATLHAVWRRLGSIFYSQRDAPGIEESPQELKGRDALSVVVCAHELRVGLSLEASGRVLVQVLDSAGRVAAAREAGRLGAGRHELTIPTRGLPSGAYLCRVTAGSEEVGSAKLTIVR